MKQTQKMIVPKNPNGSLGFAFGCSLLYFLICSSLFIFSVVRGRNKIITNQIAPIVKKIFQNVAIAIKYLV